MECVANKKSNIVHTQVSKLLWIEVNQLYILYILSTTTTTTNNKKKYLIHFYLLIKT